MTLSTDDIIQSNSGSSNGTSITCSLLSGTTAGNSVILCVLTYGAGAPTATGFTRDHGTSVNNAKSYILRKSNVAAGETSWPLVAVGSAQPWLWWAFEVQNLHRIVAMDVNSGSIGTAVGVTSQASNTTSQSTAYDGLVFAFFGAENLANTTAPVWSSYTNGFTELVSASRVDGATALGAAVATCPSLDVQTWQCTANVSVASTTGAVVVAYASATARRQANVDVMTGLEYGTTAGHATGNTSNPPWDRSTGTPAIVTTSARSGTYCLELSASAAIKNVAWTSTGALALYPAPTGFVARQYYCVRFSFLIPTSLPGSDVAIAALDNGTGTAGSGINLTYRTASQKLGLQVSESGLGTGTEVLSANALVADTWYSIDLLVDMANDDSGGQWRGYWSMDGVVQTTAVKSSSTGTSVATITEVRFGWLANTTATVRYDDIVCSKHPGHYPLGNIGVYPLKVDAAGTVTLSGTTTNFNTFTANGTVAAWNATTARNAVDEVPPTISASADGIAQVAIAASDYVEIPMETRAAATNSQGIRGVRWYFPGWAASTTAATIGFRAWDGTVETTLLAVVDPNFDNSTTTPAWVCRMHRTLASAVPYVWTQAKLDALAARVGFSTGATPDVGIHAVLAEVAMVNAVETQIFEQDGVTINVIEDPDSSNVIAYRLVAPPLVDAWSTYTISGSPVNRSATAGTTDLYVVAAESNAVATFVTGGLT